MDSRGSGWQQTQITVVTRSSRHVRHKYRDYIILLTWTRLAAVGRYPREHLASGDDPVPSFRPPRLGGAVGVGREVDGVVVVGEHLHYLGMPHHLYIIVGRRDGGACAKVRCIVRQARRHHHQRRLQAGGVRHTSRLFVRGVIRRLQSWRRRWWGAHATTTNCG